MITSKQCQAWWCNTFNTSNQRQAIKGVRHHARLKFLKTKKLLEFQVTFYSDLYILPLRMKVSRTGLLSALLTCIGRVHPKAFEQWGRSHMCTSFLHSGWGQESLRPVSAT